jgi:hypothetical protein
VISGIIVHSALEGSITILTYLVLEEPLQTNSAILSSERSRPTSYTWRGNKTSPRKRCTELSLCPSDLFHKRELIMPLLFTKLGELPVQLYESARDVFDFAVPAIAERLKTTDINKIAISFIYSTSSEFSSRNQTTRNDRFLQSQAGVYRSVQKRLQTKAYRKP